MMFSRTRFAALTAVAAASALVLAGCSGGGTTDEPADLSDVGELTEMTKISVAALPIAPTAALLLGIEQGIFEKHNLEVDLSTGQGGAAILPAVSTGQIDFAIGQPLPILLAESRGIDVTIVGNYAASFAEGDDINGVAAVDPAIQTPKDLEGKRVAVNTVNAAGDLTIREAIEQDGGDPSTVEFIEVPFPEMPGQLAGGQIDAAWLPEPFLGGVIKDGGQLVTFNYQDTIPGLTTLVAFAGAEIISERPEVVKAFQEALAETRAYANANTDETQLMLVDFLGMPEAVALNVAMEDFGPSVNVDSIKALQDLMVKFGYMEESATIDVDAIVME